MIWHKKPILRKVIYDTLLNDAIYADHHFYSETDTLISMFPSADNNDVAFGGGEFGGGEFGGGGAGGSWDSAGDASSDGGSDGGSSCSSSCGGGCGGD